MKPCRSRFIGGLESVDFPGIRFAVHYQIRAHSVDFFAFNRWTNMRGLLLAVAGAKGRRWAFGWGQSNDEARTRSSVSG